MEQILKLLKKNARMPAQDIAAATGMSVLEVNAAIEKMEADGILRGYAPIVNWENSDIEQVTAFVEIRFSLSNKMGFEQLSSEIAAMKEVDSVHLMSGGYDLSVIMKGKSIQDIAFFVNEKLSVMECVLSTSTHFVLKSYKEHGFLMSGAQTDKRGFSI